jgi:S1-C subfamily serine protease
MQRFDPSSSGEAEAWAGSSRALSKPSVTSTHRGRTLAIACVLVAMVLAGLVPTFLTANRLQGEVEELRSTVRALEDRVVVGEVNQDSLESSFSRDIEAMRATLAFRDRDKFDASLVIDLIDDAVVTIVSGDSQGSGFGLVSSGGKSWIATNYHVIENSARSGGPFVTVHHGESTWRGVVDGWDRYSDVALVKVNVPMAVLTSAYEEGHPPAIGDSVVAYGSPLGLAGSATVGIVSAIRGGYIQTDAQINHGNSGGPLVNASGEVIGLTTLGYGEGSGVGFAVDIRVLCNELVVFGC